MHNFYLYYKLDLSNKLKKIAVKLIDMLRLLRNTAKQIIKATPDEIEGIAMNFIIFFILNYLRSKVYILIKNPFIY